MGAIPDRVSFLVERAQRVLDGASADDLWRELDALPPRELVRFDWQSRSWSTGLVPKQIAALGRAELSLVSADGHERERAIRATPLTPLTVKLLVLRAVDWVAPVRRAAIARLDACPADLLTRALPLAERLAEERYRGDELGELLDARLTVRAATQSSDTRVRRTAWRRLGDAAHPHELIEQAAVDPDAVVRSVAARALERLPPHDRRMLAEALIDDRVGRIAARALAALVGLDGAAPIREALTAPSATLRRAARDWARLHGIDARAVARERGDAIALAELADPRDEALIRAMLDDPRARVRAAGLRGLARIDRPAARRAAVRRAQRERPRPRELGGRRRAQRRQPQRRRSRGALEDRARQIPHTQSAVPRGFAPAARPVGAPRGAVGGRARHRGRHLAPRRRPDRPRARAGAQGTDRAPTARARRPVASRD